MEERVDFKTELDGHKYEGAQVQVNSDPLIDSGKGDVIILRDYTFSINPEVKYTPTKQELFNYHWPQIKTMLWKDGLTHVEEIEPRVIVGEKMYTIFITCKPNLHNTVTEKAFTLQDLIPTK